MKKIVLALMLLTSVNLFAQDYSVTFSKEFKNQEKNGMYGSFENLIGSDTKGYYILKTQLAVQVKNFKYYLKYFYNDNSLQNQLELTIEKGQSLYDVPVIIVGGVPYKLYSIFSENQRVYYSKNILNNTDPAKEVGRVDAKDEDAHIRLIENKSKGEAAFLSYTTSDDKLEAVFSSFSSSMELTRQRNLSIPILSKTFTLIEAREVNNKLILVLKHNQKRSSVYDIEVHICDLESGEVNTYKPESLKGIKEVTTGYHNIDYTTRQNQIEIIDNVIFIATQLVDRNKFQGVGFAQIDLSYGISIDRSIKFSPDDVAKMKSKNPKNKVYSDDLELVKIYVRSNKEALLLFESRRAFEDIQRREISVDYGNVVILSISGGEIKSIDLIEKNQDGVRDFRSAGVNRETHLSFSSILFKDKLYVMFNDLKDRYVKTNKPVKDITLTPSSDMVSMIYQLNEQGQMIVNQLCESSTKEGAYVDFRSTFKLDNNKILLLMEGQKNNQHGIIILN